MNSLEKISGLLIKNKLDKPDGNSSVSLQVVTALEMPIWLFRPKAKTSAQTFFTNYSWESSLSSQILISLVCTLIMSDALTRG